MSRGQGLHKVRAGINKRLPRTPPEQVFAPVVAGEEYRIVNHVYPDMNGKIGVIVRRLSYNRMVALNADGVEYEIHFSKLERYQQARDVMSNQTPTPPPPPPPPTPPATSEDHTRLVEKVEQIVKDLRK